MACSESEIAVQWGIAFDRYVPHRRRSVSSTVGQVWLTFGVDMPDGPGRQAQQIHDP